MRSRFGGRLELFVQHKVLLAEGKTLDQINQSETINSFYRLRENIDTLATASYFVWLIEKATEEKHSNEPLFFLLKDSLEALLDGRNIQEARKYFQKNFLEIEGILPQVGEDLTDKVFQEHFGDYASAKKFRGMYEHAG